MLIRMIALMCLGLCGLLPPANSAETERPAKPNIIYILLDDAGYGDLSSYGQTNFQTPHIDRLAKEGLKFTDHYSASTVCAPTRCSLMTGLHTGRCYIRDNNEVRPEGQGPMPADIVTIPRLLRQSGYATGMFGKWGLGYPGSASDPTEHFDVFYGLNCQRVAHTFYPTHLWHNRERVELDGETYSHDLIMDQALDFIRHHKDRHFFCYMPVAIPHAAMQAPEDSVAPFREQFAQFEDTIGRYAGTQVRNPVAGFAGMMTRMDDGVGQVLALLEELQIDDQTLVMLSSDNGPHLEGGHQPNFFNSNGPFRGHKRDLYEGGIRVPLLARWPGQVPAGVVSDHVSAQWDMLNTFCELAGVEVPVETSGISMVPTLLGELEQQQHEYLYWEFRSRRGRQAVRMADWKGVRIHLQNNPDAPWELYNLADDPGEERNIAAAHPKIVARIAEIARNTRVESEKFPLFEQ